MIFDDVPCRCLQILTHKQNRVLSTKRRSEQLVGKPESITIKIISLFAFLGYQKKGCRYLVSNRFLRPDEAPSLFRPLVKFARIEHSDHRSVRIKEN